MSESDTDKRGTPDDRHLTTEEQKVMHESLLNSCEIVDDLPPNVERECPNCGKTVMTTPPGFAICHTCGHRFPVAVWDLVDDPLRKAMSPSDYKSGMDYWYERATRLRTKNEQQAQAIEKNRETARQLRQEYDDLLAENERLRGAIDKFTTMAEAAEWHGEHLIVHLHHIRKLSAALK